jgi:hypothetical protein
MKYHGFDMKNNWNKELKDMNKSSHVLLKQYSFSMLPNINSYDCKIILIYADLA